MNLALHSHASLLQDPFCENSALLVIIYHSSEQVQCGFFKNNNATRETKVGCIYHFHFQAESKIFPCCPPIQKGSICVHMCRQVHVLTECVRTRWMQQRKADTPDINLINLDEFFLYTKMILTLALSAVV